MLLVVSDAVIEEKRKRGVGAVEFAAFGRRARVHNQMRLVGYLVAALHSLLIFFQLKVEKYWLELG